MPTSALAALADWSGWLPFTPETVRTAPLTPGVYLFQQSGQLVYAGMAGERNGKGVRGRLTNYVNGRAPHSGLGNLALERALADPHWLRERTSEVDAGAARTVQDWARLAVQRAYLEVAWASASSQEEAAALERAVLTSLDGEPLWNRRRPGTVGRSPGMTAVDVRSELD